MTPLNVVVIGTGMYVCGRGTPQDGTVMPAVSEWSRTHQMGRVVVVGTRPEGAAQARVKIEQLQRKMGVAAAVQCLPLDGRPDPQAYARAIRELPRPGCAIVVVPDERHREVAGAALEAGLHTLVVKPLAPTMREALELLELQQRQGVYGAVEFHKRLDRANLALRDALAGGQLGELLYALVEYSQRKSVPAERFKAWVQSSDPFQYLGVHYVDVLAWATGAQPERACVVGQKGWLAARGFDTYDAIEATIEWKLPAGKRFSAHMLTSWVDPESTSAMSEQRITLVGTQGRFSSDQKRRGLQVVTDARGFEEPNPDFCAAYGSEGSVRYQGYGIDSIQQFLDDVEALEAGRVRLAELEPIRPTFQQALVSTAVVEAVQASLSRDGAWVDVDVVVRA